MKAKNEATLCKTINVTNKYHYKMTNYIIIKFKHEEGWFEMFLFMRYTQKVQIQNIFASLDTSLIEALQLRHLAHLMLFLSAFMQQQAC